MFWRKEKPKPFKYEPLLALTTIPRDEFDLTYGILIDNALIACDRKILSDIERIMKKRRNYILPPGVPVEDASELSEVMTFALVVSFVMGKINQITDRNNVMHKSLAVFEMYQYVSTEGIEWIHGYRQALNELLIYLSGDEGGSFEQIIGFTRTSTVDISDSVIDEPEPETTTAKPGRLYLDWLKSEIESGNMPVNEKGSLVHLMANDEMFIRVPDALERYSEIKEIETKKIQNQIFRLGIHRKKDDGKNLFSVKVGSRFFQGIVVTYRMKEQAKSNVVQNVA